MRFAIGPPPVADDFHPETNGWRQISEPSAFVVILIGTPIGGLVAVAFGFMWSQLLTDSFSIQFNLSTFGPWAAIVGPAMILLSFLGCFAGLIVVHESIHALACPNLGFSRETVVGFWPRRLLPYAGYLDEVPCWRFFLIAMAPFFFLSVVPLLAGALIQTTPVYLAVISTVNAVASGGDFVISAVTLSQVPLRGVVRNKGWDTWWKEADPVGST